MPKDSDAKRLSKQRYSQFADGYVSSQTHAEGNDLDILLELAEPQKDWHMIDIATGGGHTALKFSPFVNHVTATDLTKKMLQKAGEYTRREGAANISIKTADAEALPFKDGSFDLAACRIAAHHFPDPQQFLGETWRVLKPGGIFLFQDHVLPDDMEAAAIIDDFEKQRDPSHNRAYSFQAWVDMFTAAGFTVQHTQEITKRHIFLDWALRQGCSDITIQHLIEIVYNAPPTARLWMMPEKWGSQDASFTNHHLIIRAQK